jgi:hypothetical protein
VSAEKPKPGYTFSTLSISTPITLTPLTNCKPSARDWPAAPTITLKSAAKSCQNRGGSGGRSRDDQGGVEGGAVGALAGTVVEPGGGTIFGGGAGALTGAVTEGTAGAIIGAGTAFSSGSLRTSLKATINQLRPHLPPRLNPRRISPMLRRRVHKDRGNPFLDRYQPPKDLPRFPGTNRVRPKTPVQGGGGLRARWKDRKENIFEWDSEHGRVDKYDRRGRHKGEFDPQTGEQTKEADKTRSVEP